MLPAWRPVPSFLSTMVIFALFGVVFLVIGVALFVMSDEITEVSERYDEVCSGQASCNLELTVSETIPSPVFVYYQLENFYQNHRRYVKSRDYKQLMGDVRSLDDVEETCDPIIRNEDIDPDLYSINQTKLEPSAVAIPCGLVAKSVFTDKYTMSL